MSPSNFSIDHGWAKLLRPLAQYGTDLAAIQRLLDFRGDEADVRLAAELFRRAGEHENARELLRILGEGV